ncbi:MAG: PGPGW domain-containing protein [Actinomycetota bacterium]|nr:PGPGW domain-containing protein [Actinomycetota bacterium]
MAVAGSGAAKRIVLEGAGWLLVAGGVAALVLPGPGLLMIVGGLALLSQQYDWAQRRLEPLKDKALQTAADGVETWPRILLSASGVGVLIAFGVCWGIKPDVPGWWPLSEKWWLPGGWGTGASLIVSGLIALALILYSYRHLRDIKATDPTP